jgi:hypothetical protein
MQVTLGTGEVLAVKVLSQVTPQLVPEVTLPAPEHVPVGEPLAKAGSTGLVQGFGTAAANMVWCNQQGHEIRPQANREHEGDRWGTWRGVEIVLTRGRHGWTTCTARRGPRLTNPSLLAHASSDHAHPLQRRLAKCECMNGKTNTGSRVAMSQWQLGTTWWCPQPLS